MLANPEGLNNLTSALIDAAITVHRELGPGLLEAVYTECLTYELQERNFEVETNLRLPIVYRGRTLSNHYFLDLRVNREVIIEVKSIAALAPVHSAQVMTYLRLSGCHVGLLINFNAALLKDGLRRIIRGGRKADSQNM
jgi:GxxExxY protein